MKPLILLLTLTFATTAFGQSINATRIPNITFDSAFKLSNLDTLLTFDIAGAYVNSDGYKFILDSNQSYYKVEFGCYGQSIIDSGQWTLQNGNTLILTSTKTKIYTSLIKVGDYCYLVPESQRQKLITDYLSSRTKFRNMQPFTIDEVTVSVESLIRYNLLTKYYSKEPAEFASI